MDPGGKKSYDVEGITVPEGTEVITFGNDACDRWGGCYYEVKFNYENPDDNYDESMFVNCERNRFMLIPKTCGSKLLSLDYTVGANPYRTYEAANCDTKELQEDGSW